MQDLLTVPEVAAYLSTTPETIRRWLRSGKLRGQRLGGTKFGWRIPRNQKMLEGFGHVIIIPHLSNLTTQTARDGTIYEAVTESRRTASEMTPTDRARLNAMLAAELDLLV